jgi:translation initiation factor 3 subunit A
MHLVKLSKCLHSAITIIDPTIVQTKKQEKENAFKEALEKMEEDRAQAAARRLLIEKKKELRENELAKKAREEERLRLLRQQQEAEAERIRLEEESRKRELERMQQHRAEVEREEARKLAEKLAEDMKNKNIKASVSIVDNDLVCTFVCLLSVYRNSGTWTPNH